MFPWSLSLWLLVKFQNSSLEGRYHRGWNKYLLNSGHGILLQFLIVRVLKAPGEEHIVAHLSHPTNPIKLRLKLSPHLGTFVVRHAALPGPVTCDILDVTFKNVCVCVDQTIYDRFCWYVHVHKYYVYLWLISIWTRIIYLYSYIIYIPYRNI